MARHARGFTLIELIIVVAITGVMAVSFVVFVRPMVQSYFAAQQRSQLADIADQGMRTMLADVRRAVPNSIRIVGNQCFELVPSVGGGRYRMGPDVTNDTPSGCASGSSSTCSAWIDTTTTTTVFDALSITGTAPAASDWIVVDNQNGNDVYTGSNRATVSSVSTPTTTQGVLRINIPSTQFHQGYAEGRFQTVSASEPAVSYVCSGADGTLDSKGDGKGTIYRITRSFVSTYPSSCPSTTGALVVGTVATKVLSCNFIYDANHGATQQSGFLWLEFEVVRNNESAHMGVGAHVSNVP